MSQNLYTDRAVTRRGLFAGTAALAVTLGVASRPHAAAAQTLPPLRASMRFSSA